MEENKEILVESKLSSPAVTLTFLFTNLSFMFWLAYIGVFGEGAGFVIGLCQIAFFPAYLIGGILLLKKNDAWNGNIFLIFATFFGATAGLTSGVSYIMQVLDVPCDMGPVNVAWILCGVLLLASLPGIKSLPWTYFLIFLLAGAALVLMGVGGFGVLGAWWAPVSGWMFGVVGLLGIYCTIVGLNEHAGLHMPLGPPIFK